MQTKVINHTRRQALSSLLDELKCDTYSQQDETLCKMVRELDPFVAYVSTHIPLCAVHHSLPQE